MVAVTVRVFVSSLVSATMSSMTMRVSAEAMTSSARNARLSLARPGSAIAVAALALPAAK